MRIRKAIRSFSTLPLKVLCFGELLRVKKVIVTVERVVDTDFIRRHSYLVKIPGYLVDAVVELPFWGPSSLYVPEDFGGGYAEDYDFLVDFRNASMERERLEKWIEEWVMNVDHWNYLEKPGYESAILGGQVKARCMEIRNS